MIRQHGRANENPTIAQVLKNAQNIRVINSIWVDKITGNCRGCKRKSYDLESVNLHDLKSLCQRGTGIVHCKHNSNVDLFSP